jgi:glycosyltransferase involved in cell wall biosynthesis
MLEPWSLGYRKIKKAICWRLYQQRTLAGATAFSVTSEQEAESVRRLGFRQPVAVIANGVQIPPLRQSIHLERPTALFMSRLHRKKGIYELLAAWKRLTPPDWQLLIAGTDEDGEEKQIRAHIRTLGLEQCCTLIGPLAGKRKEALLASVNLFLLPSHSENFGQAVVESLAHGVPVLTTTGTPWSSLVSHRCGWWVELDADSLDRGIREATSLPLATLAEMGERGRRFVGETFTWSQIADQTSCFYDWLLHGGERPGYIL